MLRHPTRFLVVQHKKKERVTYFKKMCAVLSMSTGLVRVFIRFQCVLLCTPPHEAAASAVIKSRRPRVHYQHSLNLIPNTSFLFILKNLKQRILSTVTYSWIVLKKVLPLTTSSWNKIQPLKFTIPSSACARSFIELTYLLLTLLRWHKLVWRLTEVSAHKAIMAILLLWLQLWVWLWAMPQGRRGNIHNSTLPELAQEGDATSSNSFVHAHIIPWLYAIQTEGCKKSHRQNVSAAKSYEKRVLEQYSDSSQK